VLAIATLVLWALNAGVGVALLTSGNAARRRAAGPARAASVPAGHAANVPAGSPANPAGPAASAPARYAAVPLTEDGRPPRVPRAKVVAPAGAHPLLEFSHPALALAGFGCWFAFVLVHYRPFAWVSIGVLVATAGAGLGWLARNRLAARRSAAPLRVFPPRLITLHGLAATALLACTLLTALFAAHG
jgi:hypothetical protein